MLRASGREFGFGGTLDVAVQLLVHLINLFDGIGALEVVFNLCREFEVPEIFSSLIPGDGGFIQSDIVFSKAILLKDGRKTFQVVFERGFVECIACITEGFRDVGHGLT